MPGSPIAITSVVVIEGPGADQLTISGDGTSQAFVIAGNGGDVAFTTR
jgi:hypothetical protein